MSRLEDLIQTRCPDGVEFENLGDFASIDKGQQLNLTRMTDDLPYPVMNGGIKPSGYFDQYNTEENTIAISQGGASAGYINFIETKFWAGAHCYVVKPKKSTVVNKFLYYLLKNSETEIQNAKYGAGIPGLNKSTLEHLVLPIPPLQVQEEIVRILDTFSSVVAELEQKMNAEQAARIRQYEHYSHKLLFLSKNSFENISRFIRLGDIAHYSRERISAKEIDKTSYVGVDNILQNKKGKVDSDYVPISGTLIKYQRDDILIGNIRPYLRKIWIADRDGGTNGDVLCLQINKGSKQSIIPKYLFHILASEEFFTYAIKNSRGAKMPRGDKALTLKFEFPLPPLSVQEEIVSILDRFDALVNDLKSGLPAEIAARRKQYEYYRDRLLTFKPLNDV